MVKTLVCGVKTITWGAGSCKAPGGTATSHNILFFSFIKDRLMVSTWNTLFSLFVRKTEFKPLNYFIGRYFSEFRLLMRVGDRDICFFILQVLFTPKSHFPPLATVEVKCSCENKLLRI